MFSALAGLLHLEDRPDGVVDLLKFFRGGATQVLDETATWWAIDLQGERPTELGNLHRASSEPGSESTTCIAQTVGNSSLAFTASAETTSLVVDWPALAITDS
ncbi:MAG: hypothetical protein ACRDSM_06360 [Pseudonocardiaceae bacterium]